MAIWGLVRSIFLAAEISFYPGLIEQNTVVLFSNLTTSQKKSLGWSKNHPVLLAI
jgi:hypothetical protein